MEPCIHHPRTTLHLSISWCSLCQEWQLHYSQSGRHEPGVGVVLIEVLRTSCLESEAIGPDDIKAFAQDLLMAAQELEHDRIDTDALLGAPRHLKLI